MADSNLVELTGLWSKDAKDGKKYLSGSMGGARVLVLANGFKKEGSNEPDYRLYVARKEKQEKSETPI